MSATRAAAILQIDLDAVASNIRLLQSRAPKSRMAGIVKANAYGIGMEQVANVHKALGTKTYFVATLDEGIFLRSVLGPGYEIAVLGGLYHDVESDYIAYNLTPVINSLGEASRLRAGQAAILHVDTGMNRLGLDHKETQRVMDDPGILKDANIVMVMSHFACADEPGNSMTVMQAANFAKFATLFPQARKSLSNSAGIFASSDYHHDLIRPGMAVYGLNPTPDQPNPMQPVVRLKVRILQIRDAQAGQTVGYGASFKTEIPCRLATVALGYADGFLRSLGNAGQLFWMGDRGCPIVGRVSMDAVTVDVTGVGGPSPQAGDWLEVIGPAQDADTLAAAAGTIGYEILTNLGQRYARTYLVGKSL